MRHETLLAKNVARITDSQKQAMKLRAATIRRGEVGVAQ